VMITKEAQGVKQAVVTDRLSITGRYAVVTERPAAENRDAERAGSKGDAAYGRQTGRWFFSSKLTQFQKEELRTGLGDAPAGFDVLLRTKARGAAPEDILEEINAAARKLTAIRQEASGGKAYSVLYRPPQFYETMLRDLPVLPDRVFSDLPSVVESLKTFCPETEAYEDRTMTLAERFGLDREIEKLNRKVVWLKSGAYLVIEQTEALTAIDINSGHSRRGRNAEETCREINQEAIAEAARQIRLREIGGMILVDLMKNQSEEEAEELLKYAREELKKDRRHAEAYDITRLGLLEIVRQKTAPPLAEILGE